MKILLVANLYPIPEEPSFGTFVKNQEDDLRAAGVDVDVFFVNGRKNKLNYIWGVFRLWKQLFKEKYDLLHCHYIFGGIIGRMQWKYPVLVTHHGIEVVDGSWVAKLTKAMHPLFDRVIVVNEEQKRVLDDPTIAVIPCGINFKVMRTIPKDEARKELGLPLNKKLVLWAGEHWRPEKRYHLVEGAVELLKQRDPDVELVLVSGQPHHVIPLYMNACDALALTSTHEGSPMVIKEAMACNLPIVSTDVGDVSQVIEGVEGCYLCEANSEDVANQLSKILAWGQRTTGRQKIQHLSSEHAAERIIEIYNEMCQPERRMKIASTTN